jgi:murein DD-endopeptidase MepM/ murein hydrolase activator NlpD
MRRRISSRHVLIGTLAAETAGLLVLLCYLAFTEKVLVVRFAAPAEVDAPAVSDRLVIPVAGVRPAELNDTYGAPRSGGRSHEGLDILAPEGTPVLAAATGVIVKRDSSARGGISLYQRDLDGRTIYFYGHLQRYRAGLKEGDLVRQGSVVAHVGQTGNAPPGTPHLHFSVYTVTDPNRWWRGRNINPCDLLPCGVADAVSEPPSP